MSQPLADKVAIVTGASSGIGAATAHELARRGARVVLAARRTEELEVQVRAITEVGGQAISIPTDITDVVQVIRLVKGAQQAFGQVNVLVNNAGANWVKAFAETSADEMSQMLQVNLLGAMLLTNMLLPQMLQQSSGTIISVGSVASRVAIEPLYSATKFGVRGFSLALRRQLAGSGISVSLVTPGNIRTSMTRGMTEYMPEPELVARVIASLVSHPHREVIIPLKYHAIIWLDQFLPGMADFLFHWRHRRDREQRNSSNLPTYARTSEMEIPR